MVKSLLTLVSLTINLFFTDLNPGTTLITRCRILRALMELGSSSIKIGSICSRLCQSNVVLMFGYIN